MHLRCYFPLLVCLFGAAHGDTYDFSYSATGDPRLVPIQVFDNGTKTWLQVPQLQPPPVIFAVTPAGEVILPARQEGQMLVVDRVEQQLAIVLGRARAKVRYTGSASRQDEGASFGQVPPSRSNGSAPTPLPAAAILTARKAPPAPAEEAVQAPLAPASAPKATTPASPAPTGDLAVAASKPTPTTSSDSAAAQAPSLNEWSVRPDDGDLETLLQRWADTATPKWQLSWEATKRYPVKFHATLKGSFEEAVTDALRPYARGTDPIKGCTYDNNVLRVVPKPTVCEIQ